MFGTIVNTVLIILGTLIGTVLKKGIKEEYQATLFNAMGFAAVALGANAVVQNMPKSAYPVLFIVSLAIGSFVGAALNLAGRFNRIVGRFGNSNLNKGLSTAILLFCIGTLSILGPIESALHNNHTYLLTNATLDFVTSIALAATYGIGIMFSAVVLFFWQGGIYLLAGYLEPFLTEGLMAEVSIVGGVLIFASGLSILGIKDSKTLNMLPALLVPVVWYIIISFL
ncbi:DUF554 domain-containing protein [Solibacillus daqui]|uniref:DUF554 domain-containing protein n=1 Tax=Solibacillus daqui TaxID=2912187 RepID=UPI00236705A8|nr:DUF554 domain-containing protein [Solibacillus daqui]